MKEMVCAALLENIPQVTAFIEQELEKADCPMRAQMQINVAVDEIFSNIARYAYAPGTGEARVRIACDPERREAEITFIDSGVPYNPLEKEDPDTTLSAEEREIGGLGILLVKKTMDDMRYRYENGQNQLTLIKKI